jgi:hypothetical protein
VTQHRDRLRLPPRVHQTSFARTSFQNLELCPPPPNCLAGGNSRPDKPPAADNDLLLPIWAYLRVLLINACFCVATNGVSKPGSSVSIVIILPVGRQKKRGSFPSRPKFCPFTTVPRLYKKPANRLSIGYSGKLCLG